MTTKRLLYLTGPPGSGKSTLMAAVIETLGGVGKQETKPFAHCHLGGSTPGEELIVLGKYGGDEMFPGTDRLSMSVQPKVIEFLLGEDGPAYVAGEGDRLASALFFDRLSFEGVEVFHIAVMLDEATLARRREARGWEPNQAWLKGRHTKASKLAVRCDLQVSGLLLGTELQDMALNLAEMMVGCTPNPD